VPRVAVVLWLGGFGQEQWGVVWDFTKTTSDFAFFNQKRWNFTVSVGILHDFTSKTGGV
jgi:hypothetical protein